MKTWLLSLGLLLFVVVSQSAVAGTVTYVYTDPQGTPLAEADANGTITARFDYAPYGAAVTSLGAAPNGPGYTGHVNDPESGLIYMQARYYDPATGRLLNADPVGPSPGSLFHFNRYDYASNNPIVNMDPDGRQSTDDICMGNMQCESNEGGSDDPYAGHFYVQDQIANSVQEGQAEDQHAIATAAPYVYGAADLIPGVSLVKCAAEGCSGPDWVLATIAVIPVEGELGTAAKAIEKTADTAKTELTVIGRVNDLQKLNAGEKSLLDRLPNLGGPKANWQQNAGVLREEIARGLPIRDASPGDTAGQFLNAERNLLIDRGWSFDSQTNLWEPPKQQ